MASNDTISVGSGTNVLIRATESAATSHGDTITLLSGHTAVDTIVSSVAVAPALSATTTGQLEILNGFSARAQSGLALESR